MTSRRLCPTRSDARAFTLIELLVVVSIIAVLAGVAFPTIRGVLDRAKKVQAKNDVVQLTTAVGAYYTEYGKYPVDLTPGSNTDAYFGAGAAPSNATSYGGNDLLVDVLRNNATGSHSAKVLLLNPRQIVFISPPDVKSTASPKSGIGSNGQYYDPWGLQYTALLDTNYDNALTNPYPDTDGSAGASELRAGAVAFSSGKDMAKGVKGSGRYKNSDDVLSWQ